MSITLSKTETQILIAAAGHGGVLHFPETMKPITRQRMLGRFEAEGFIVADGTEPRLTPAGYRAVGLPAPTRKKKAAVLPDQPNGKKCSVTKAISPSAEAQPIATEPAPPRSGTKNALVIEMLDRDDGASLDELMEATGWLPHTTRAALSRIRSSGQTLVKSRRTDGRASYRIGAV